MGTSNNAASAAAAQQAQQQQQIQASVNQINSAYGSPARQAQYDTYGKNLNDYYTNQVNTQEATNARNLKFANARSGLTGGSAATDSNTQLQKDYTTGLLTASQNAQAGTAALKNADTQSKNQQISLAQQGNYVGQIPLATSEAQSANLQSAQNYGNANAVNNLFSGTAGIYQNEQVAAANRKAQQSPIGSIYGGTSTSSPSPWG
jgi:hypothetical protein